MPAQTSEPGLTWRTATPALLVGGTYVEVVQTAGTSATPGAVVHYTTNGNDPIESDPVFPSGLLSITQTTTLKARAWAAGKPPSSIAVDTYTLQVPLPVSSPSGFFEEYGAPVNVTLSTPPLTGVTIYYTLDGSTPAIGAPGTFTYSSPITLTTQTLLRFFGVKPGWTNGDVRSVLYRFNYGTLAAPTITPSAGTYVYGEPVTLTAIAGATIRYTTDGSTPSPSSSAYTGPIALTGAMTLRAVAFHTDWRDSPVASAAFVAQAVSPPFSPDARTYADGQLITVSVPTPGATIRYTNNGQDPTEYDPIIPSGGTLPVGNFTLKARAFSQGLVPSAIRTAEYARLGDPCRYTLSPAVIVAGPFASGGVVSVSTADASCAWTNTSDSSWLTVSPASGSGLTGQVVYHLAANPGATLRTGLITIGGTRFCS